MKRLIATLIVGVILVSITYGLYYNRVVEGKSQEVEMYYEEYIDDLISDIFDAGESAKCYGDDRIQAVCNEAELRKEDGVEFYEVLSGTQVRVVVLGVEAIYDTEVLDELNKDI